MPAARWTRGPVCVMACRLVGLPTCLPAARWARGAIGMKAHPRVGMLARPLASRWTRGAACVRTRHHAGTSACAHAHKSIEGVNQALAGRWQAYVWAGLRAVA